MNSEVRAEGRRPNRPSAHSNSDEANDSAWSSIVHDVRRAFDLHGVIPAGLSRAQYEQVARYAVAHGSKSLQTELFDVYPRREAVRRAHGHPHLPNAWLALGDVLQAAGRHQDGVDMWQRAYRAHDGRNALQEVRAALQNENTDPHRRAYAQLHLDALTVSTSQEGAEAPSSRSLQRCAQWPHLDPRLRAWAAGDREPLLGSQPLPSPSGSLAMCPPRDPVSGHWLAPLPKPRWRAIEVDGMQHQLDAAALERGGTGDVLLAMLGESATWAPMPQSQVASVQVAPSSLRAIDSFLSTGTLPIGLRPFEQNLLRLDSHFLGLDLLLIELDQFFPLRQQLAKSTHSATRARALLSLGNSYFDHGSNSEAFSCWQLGIGESSCLPIDDEHGSHHASARAAIWHRYHSASLDLFDGLETESAARSLGERLQSEPAAVTRLRAYLAALGGNKNYALALFREAAEAAGDETIIASWAMENWFAHSADRFAEEPATMLASLRWVRPDDTVQKRLDALQKATLHFPKSPFLNSLGDHMEYFINFFDDADFDFDSDFIVFKPDLAGPVPNLRASHNCVIEKLVIASAIQFTLDKLKA